MELKKVVVDSISKILKIAPEDIKEEYSIRQDLGADSLDMVEIMMEVEKTLNITIDDEGYIEIDSVRDMITALDKIVN